MACQPAGKPTPASQEIPSAPSLTFLPAATPSVTGDFDGDGRRDTLVWHLVSALTGKAIDSVPDPLACDWYEQFLPWYEAHSVGGYLASARAGLDTLHISHTNGPHLLLNIGDSNQDGKEELAVSFDSYDFSLLNSFTIVYLCNNEWKYALYSTINESVFYDDSCQSSFHGIQDYLEKRNGRWMYRDYLKWMNADPPQDTLFRPLRLEKCR